MKIFLHSLCLLGGWLFSLGTSHAQTTISYPQPFYCQDGSNPSPTITGTTGGSFTAGAGLAINSTTGIVDLASSAIGIYTILYSINSDTARTSFEVVARDDASFSYLDTVICVGGISDTPMVATPNGFFSYMPINNSRICLDPSTGIINITGNCNYTIGTSTIVYTTRGRCPASSTQDITVGSSGFTPTAIAYPGSRVYCQSRGRVTPTIVLGTLSGGEQFSGSAGLIIDSITGTIDLLATSPGSYTVIFTGNNSCGGVTSNQAITIVADDDASFSYTDSVFCRFDNDPSPTITGLSGGSFSASSGLAVNATTGEINLSGSVLGQFQVYYTTNDVCPSTDSVLVQVDTLDDASFSYDTTAFCQNGGVILPTIQGEQGGSFASAPFGLALNRTTGAIDLGNSAVSNYLIIYNTNNPCASSSTFGMDIDSVPSFVLDYGLDSFCNNDPNQPSPITIPSSGLGQFNVQPTGLVVNSSGTLDLSASIPGNYVVSFTTNAGNNSCSITTTDSIVIV